MAKRTPKSVPALVDYMAQVTGDPESTLGHIARRIRESGVGKISQKGHGRGAAKATSQDAATILLVSMATDKAIHAGVVADALADLRLVGKDDELIKDAVSFGKLKLKARDPIGVLTEVIDGLQEGTLDPDGVKYVEVLHGGTSAGLFDGDVY